MWQNKIVIFDKAFMEPHAKLLAGFSEEEKDVKALEIMMAHLDELGRDGWEPYGVEIEANNSEDDGIVYFLKRWVME